MSQIAADLGVLSQREFRFAGVVRKTFQIFLRNAVPFSLIGIIAWLPLGLVSYFTLDKISPKQRVLSDAGVVLSYFLLQLIAVAAIVPGAFQDMRGRPMKLSESIRRGLRQFFPLIGSGILAALGVTLGFVLLAIPGFILFTRWYVLAPVCVVEQKGALGSMKRSAELTKGNRWKLFAIAIIVLVGGAFLGELIDLLLGVLRLPSAAAPLVSASVILAVAVQSIFEGVWFAFSNILSVMIYHDLRAAKEGADIESIASVFD
jgi:hypothetical protein